ncbi:MAG: pyrroline-5-carboxylate reductase [Flavobacteriaceae bacterium]|nr:pyrroline-5-carboxylate reductase [Flavobacteriaceae bacterium]
MKIAIIGTGNLGLSIAKGMILNNSFTTLYLTRRNTQPLNKWKDSKKVYITSNNSYATKHSDIIICSVQPTQFREILHDLKPILNKKHLLISTVAGFTINEIERILSPDISIVRAMPNTAISVRKSMTCLCSNDSGKKTIEVANAIFGRLGNTAIIDEAHMRAATVLCASGIAFWMRLIRATTQGGVQLGFDADEALKMSMYTAMGAASLLIDGKKHPESEIDKVTTPMGCTITGLNEMEHRGVSSSIIKGLAASFDKINEISKES